MAMVMVALIAINVLEADIARKKKEKDRSWTLRLPWRVYIPRQNLKYMKSGMEIWKDMRLVQICRVGI